MRTENKVLVLTAIVVMAVMLTPVSIIHNMSDNLVGVIVYAMLIGVFKELHPRHRHTH